MALTDQYTRLYNIREDCKTSLSNKGLTIPDNTLFTSIPNLINSIVTPIYQSKTVNPSTNKQTITPDSGYNALSQVIINAISGNVTKSGTITFNVDETHYFTATHNLGVVPNFCVCFLYPFSSLDLHWRNSLFGYAKDTGFHYWGGYDPKLYYYKYDHTKDWATLSSLTTSTYYQKCMFCNTATTSTITFGNTTSDDVGNSYFEKNTYCWVVGNVL